MYQSFRTLRGCYLVQCLGIAELSRRTRREQVALFAPSLPTLFSAISS
jgi:hypothetical protein